jgi:HK97 family phage portal protein
MMNFKIFSKKKADPVPVMEQKSAVREIIIPLQSGSFLEYAFSGNQVVSGLQAFSMYRTTAAIATAVDMIAESVQQIRPVIKTKNGEIITDHPVLDLLDQPNGFQSYSDFIGDVVRHYLLKHDSHVIAFGNINRMPLQLYAAKPFNVIPTENQSDGYASKYDIFSGVGSGSYKRQEQGTSIARFYDGTLKELYHIMGFSSRSTNTEADSPLCAAALDAKQLIRGKYHNLKLLENGGRLSLLVTFKGETPSDDEHKIRKQRIVEDLTGENTGGIAVTSAEDIDIKELGNTNKDMDYSVMNDLSSKAVYFRYRIPLPLVSNDAATYNNFEQATVALYDWAVLPTAGTCFDGLSKFIMPRSGIDPSEMWLDYDPEQIPALRSRRLQELKIRKDINVETINELRSDIPNRDDVEGGDVIYINGNLVPIGEPLSLDEDESVPTMSDEDLAAMSSEGKALSAVDIKPFANEHACRMTDPDKYKEFRRVNAFRKHEGKAIDFIFGITKDGKTEVQAMRYPVKVWTEKDAKQHCKDHSGMMFEAAKKSALEGC